MCIATTPSRWEDERLGETQKERMGGKETEENKERTNREVVQRKGEIIFLLVGLSGLFRRLIFLHCHILVCSLSFLILSVHIVCMGSFH